MKVVQVELTEALVEAAQLDRANPSPDAARLLALELFREDKVSLGRAAELCQTPLEAFMEFAAQHEVPLHYGTADLEADSPHTATPPAVKVVSNASPLITLARIGRLDSLRELYSAVTIPAEVYNEVVVAGAGMPGAAAVAKADWIRVSAVQDTEGFARAISMTGLGAGEIRCASRQGVDCGFDPYG
jgi:predicted HTH domain antitoxin